MTTETATAVLEYRKQNRICINKLRHRKTHANHADTIDETGGSRPLSRQFVSACVASGFLGFGFIYT